MIVGPTILNAVQFYIQVGKEKGMDGGRKEGGTEGGRKEGGTVGHLEK